MQGFGWIFLLNSWRPHPCGDGGTPSPRPPYVSPPSITPARPYPKGGGLLRARISGQIFRLKFQDPSNPKKSQKIPQQYQSILHKIHKEFQNKIPANFPIYYLANSHISKKESSKQFKNTFFFRGWGSFFKRVPTRKNFSGKFFFFAIFSPSQGIKRKRREFTRLCCKSASNASELVVKGDCKPWLT